MNDWQSILAKPETKKLKRSASVGFTPLMLATLTDEYFDDKNWIYERKLDGVRCEVIINKGKVSLWSRNEKNISNTYPELVEALEKENYPNLIADGEIVALSGNVTSFSKLQARMQIKDADKARQTGVKVYLYLFDLLNYDGFDVKELALENRKKILKKAINFQNPIRYTTHKNETGTAFLKEACNKGWEGLIAKDRNATYVNSRSKKWLKFKCTKGQELVIGGFTEPQGEREGFGAMLVGFYKGETLKYAGKVGTGFDDDFLKKWRKKFDREKRKTSPFDDFNDDNGGKNHWISPKFVGEFGFTEWTKSNKLRHPRFLGMRDDKKPGEVVKETPK